MCRAEQTGRETATPDSTSSSKAEDCGVWKEDATKSRAGPRRLMIGESILRDCEAQGKPLCAAIWRCRRGNQGDKASGCPEAVCLTSFSDPRSTYARQPLEAFGHSTISLLHSCVSLSYTQQTRITQEQHQHCVSLVPRRPLFQP